VLESAPPATGATPIVQPGPWESPWTRSSLCASGNCVEVAVRGAVVMVRDSKDPASAPLTYSRDEWHAFVSGVKLGEFDLGD